MSFTNALPSAPAYNEAQPLYPTHELAQLNAEDFRLKKINDLLKELSDEASQALADKQISDVEFRIITREVEKYHTLKAEIRAGGGKQVVTSEVATQTQEPDLEKLKDELRKEVKREFQKKVSLLTAVSKSDLKE